MPRATLIIKPTPHYRRDAFEAGFKRLGFDIAHSNHNPRPGDAVCLWNLTGGMEKEAERFRKAGAAVVVCENAYLTPAGVPQMYAISRDGHCGAGRFPADPAARSRWDELGAKLQPWRKEGDHILVVAQRGIGSREMASPHGWAEKTAAKIQTVTRRPVRIRQHPGNKMNARLTPLADDFRDAWAVVTWSSSTGVHALVAGIPVFYAAPHWICSGAALPFNRFAMFVESPMCDDSAREKAMVRMAQGQFHYREIAEGWPLQGVLSC